MSMSVHGGQVGPPQSISVSEPFWIPSVQEGVKQEIIAVQPKSWTEPSESHVKVKHPEEEVTTPGLGSAPSPV